MNEQLLPDRFPDLAPFVDAWALPTEKERFHRRISTPLEEVKTFNDAMYRHIHDVIGWLDQYPLEITEPQVERLMNLARAYMETSHPVDLGWKTTDLADAFPSDRFEFLEPSC